MREVAVVGVGMSPFVAETTQSLREQTYRAGRAALDDAGLAFPQVQAVYMGYLWEPTMTGIRFLKELGLTGVHAQHVQNASATGAGAMLEAVRAVAGGHADVAMAIGFDDMNKIAGAGLSKNSAEGVILPAAFFALWAKQRQLDYGTTSETLARIAAKNWNNGALNPMAQRRPTSPITFEQILGSRMVADPLTSMMSAAVGQGAAAVIVTTPELARKYHPGRPTVLVKAAKMRTETMTEGHVFAGPVVGPQQMTRDTAQDAYEQAGLGPEDLDLVQVHDAFPIEELVYYELLGICPDGEGDKLVLEGATELGGRIPFSTDGGLIGRGHPGGPTGLAQIWETTLQLRGEAGARQVADPQVGLCHMVGGGSVCVIHILQRAD
ncbi:thiolase family protein [Nocardioides marmoriginsengisoli]|uniref:Thiolase family protein n=1 Tax=Nocardioides marmoriginsengisoli TaxID=661483 RepID=A0A3N0CH46_9ACTN|nr:thiolase family protein [Nocardioides marmoriginsengisoli]RNL62772.1 thiolase family protein [Nocardioides marmoriginsengisoli]